MYSGDPQGSRLNFQAFGCPPFVLTAELIETKSCFGQQNIPSPVSSCSLGIAPLSEQ